MNDTSKVALVMGVTGSIGREVATVLKHRGWHIRALHRDPAQAKQSLSLEVEWVKGDAMHGDDVITAARNTDLIVHAVNPPKYHNWYGLALPMLENTILAAKANRARILLPATIYNFAPDVAPILTENSPQRPLTRKGQVRVEMETRLRQASLEGVRALVVRSGDFFGPDANNSWLTHALVRSKGPLRTIHYPGPENVGHAWAYVPDLAEAMVQLIERENQLANFDVFHFRGHWFERGIEIAETICRIAQISRGNIKPFPWWMIRLTSPFVEVFREMLEMRYLWQVPMELDNAKLVARLDKEPHTPIDVALRATLGHLLCENKEVYGSEQASTAV